jgi:serine/threonine protein phosphatase PrpC
VKLTTFALSDIGHVRPENEDNLLRDDQRQLYAVADGIGGLPGGAQASQTAIAALTEWFSHQTRPPFDYAAALTEINDRVFQLGRVLSPRQGIGTTFTFAHFDLDHVVVVHVGDTSMFRLREGDLEALTVDHNVENELRARLARGEVPVFLTENRAALTRCVGQPPPLEGDIHAHPVHAGDRYLLCSDGITRYVLPPEMRRVLGALETPEAVCRTLVNLANERGGVDNSTALAVFVE